MRIVLHAGFHKTGTTSLQASLGAHRQMIAPYAQCLTLKISQRLSTATKAARAFSAGEASHHDLARDMQAWAADLPDMDQRHLLISSEDFAGHMPGRFGIDDYRALLVTGPCAVQALHGRFPGAAITVLVTTRGAEPWLKSLHWQLAKHPDLLLKQKRFCKDYAKAADFAAVLTPLKAALAPFGDLVVAPLETLKTRRLGPVEALYDLIDLPDALRQTLVVAPVKNRNPSDGLADQFVQLNRAKLPAEELERAKTAMALVMRDLDEA
jgi:hypothetical protein